MTQELIQKFFGSLKNHTIEFYEDELRCYNDELTKKLKSMLPKNENNLFILDTSNLDRYKIVSKFILKNSCVQETRKKMFIFDNYFYKDLLDIFNSLKSSLNNDSLNEEKVIYIKSVLKKDGFENFDDFIICLEKLYEPFQKKVNNQIFSFVKYSKSIFEMMSPWNYEYYTHMTSIDPENLGKNFIIYSKYNLVDVTSNFHNLIKNDYFFSKLFENNLIRITFLNYTEVDNFISQENNILICNLMCVKKQNGNIKYTPEIIKKNVEILSYLYVIYYHPIYFNIENKYNLFFEIGCFDNRNIFYTDSKIPVDDEKEYSKYLYLNNEINYAIFFNGFNQHRYLDFYPIDLAKKIMIARTDFEIFSLTSNLLETPESLEERKLNYRKNLTENFNKNIEYLKNKREEIKYSSENEEYKNEHLKKIDEIVEKIKQDFLISDMNIKNIFYDSYLKIKIYNEVFRIFSQRYCRIDLSACDKLNYTLLFNNVYFGKYYKEIIPQFLGIFISLQNNSEKIIDKIFENNDKKNIREFYKFVENILNEEKIEMKLPEKNVESEEEKGNIFEMMNEIFKNKLNKFIENEKNIENNLDENNIENNLDENNIEDKLNENNEKIIKDDEFENNF